jgi:hypothetical protein
MLNYQRVIKLDKMTMEKSPPKNLNYDNYGFYWQIFGYTDDMWVQTWSIFFTARFARQR